MAGADLANLVNEGALVAARRSHEAVTGDDLLVALERVILGAERGIVLSELDRRRTAYHEAGHALVALLTPGADPVRKVSIIPRGVALGVTYYEAESDRWNYTVAELRALLKVLLGGQAAERLVFGDATTGLESDLDRLTQLARRMVGRWGMSERVGFVSVLSDGQLLEGDAVSDATRALVDDEVRRIVEDADDEVFKLLSRERSRLDALAAALLDRETLDGDEIHAAAGLEGPDVAPVDQHAMEIS
jgi:cell division protease FtsH